MKQRVFSGIQPTGNAHLGNYLGALRNWVKLQDDYDCVYSVVDLHAMTTDYEPQQFHKDRIETAKRLLAVGIDPDRSLLFFQSEVPQHAELAWILGTITPMGVLNRMTQFKDKTSKGIEGNLGLYSYPVLMAADILAYRADLVPVGEDQRQHLEVTRDLAERFNNRFGEVFPIPDALIPETSARVMSLTDPTSKMSKSDPSEKSRILIGDSADMIRKRIKSAVTDSDPTVRYDVEAKPGISNLLEIMSACTGRSVEALADEYADAGYGVFKEAVADSVIELLAPINEIYAGLDDEEVRRVMDKRLDEARSRAEAYQAEVRAAVGLA